MLKRWHNGLESSSLCRQCRAACTVANTTTTYPTHSSFPRSAVDRKVESQKSLQVIRVRRRLQSFLRGRLKFANFPALDTQRFLVFLEQCKKRRRPDQAHSVAANLLTRTKDLGEPVWSAALLHYVHLNDATGFKATLHALLKSEKNGEKVVIDEPAIVSYAFKVSTNDSDFLESLLRLTSRAVEVERCNDAGLYGTVCSSLMKLDQHSVHKTLLKTWHDSLLISGFKPSEVQISKLMKILCSNEIYQNANWIENILQQYKQHSVQHGYQYVISEFFLQRRFDQVDRFFRLMLTEERKLSNLNALEGIVAGLLDYCVRFSTTTHTDTMIRLVMKSGIKFTKTAKLTLARFYGIRERPKMLSTVLQMHSSSDDDFSAEKDTLWAAYLRGRTSTSKQTASILLDQLLRFHPVLGEKCLQVLIENATSKTEAFKILHMMLQKHLNINHRGYATCIRFIAKEGDSEKAWALMNACLISEKGESTISDKDASFVGRNLILGLLEGQHIEDLEKRHMDMFLSGLSTVDTWNLLLRARLSDNRLHDAVTGLQEMQIHGLDVENATAQEFMTTILRHRKPGHNPDVLNAKDNRPYLADIKSAISVGYRCLSLGGRMQPETWREVMKRLGLYGEFESLDSLSAWLIMQYSSTQPEKGQSPKLFRMTETQKQLPDGNPHQVLSRLIKPVDICATITRGFRTGKPIEALNLVVKWRSQGLYVPNDLVKKRLQTGLRYMAGNPSTSATDLRVLRENLTLIFAKLA